MKRAGKLTPNCLRKYRKLMGYSQVEVASLLGLKGHSHISEWESGMSKPCLDNLFRLSILYRTPVDELYFEVRLEFIKDMEARLRDVPNPRDEGG